MINTLLLLAALAAPGDGELRKFRFSATETIAATIYGSGARTIVIIPGLIGSTYSWRLVTPELVAAGRRVIIVDLLGTGSSSRPHKADYSLTAQSRRVEQVLDSLGVRDAVVLTHAIAGSVAYRLALHRPEQVKAIVAIDGGAAERAATSGMRKAMSFAPLIKFLGAKRIMTGKLKSEMTDRSGNPGWVTPEVLKSYAAPYNEDAGEMLKVLQAMAGSGEPEALVPNLQKIEAPVILLVGNKPRDQVLAPEKIQVLREGLRNFKVEVVEGVGVFIQEEKPQAVIDVVLSVG